MKIIPNQFKSPAVLFRTLSVLLGLWLLMSTPFPAAAQGSGENAQGTQGQLDVKVVHVDKYGVYVPELIFYWDSSLGKQKIAALTAVAERLRNKRATLTYSAKGSPTTDKHPLVLDIVPHQEPQHTVWTGTTSTETSESMLASAHTAGVAGGREDTAGLADPYPQRDVGSPGSSSSEASGRDQDVSSAGEDPDLPPTQVWAQPLPIQKRDALMLVEHLLHLTGKKSLDSILYYYADSVSYYARGDVGKDYIRRDLGYYFKNWDSIQCALDGDIQLLDTSRPDVKLVRFQSSYTVENDRKTVSGATDNTWKVQRTRTGLKVIDQKQSVLDSRIVERP